MPCEAAFNRLLPHVLPCSRTLGGRLPRPQPFLPQPVGAGPGREGGNLHPGTGEDAVGRADGTASQGCCDKECQLPALTPTPLSFKLHC